MIIFPEGEFCSVQINRDFSGMFLLTKNPEGEFVLPDFCMGECQPARKQCVISLPPSSFVKIKYFNTSLVQTQVYLITVYLWIGKFSNFVEYEVPHLKCSV